MKITNLFRLVLAIGIFVLMGFQQKQEDNRTRCILIGDSTVKNGKGKGDGGLWGWGNYLANFLDSNKIAVENHALGGTSSRTFQTNGLWDKALERVRKGDYVIMQFGHNDSSPLDDTARARGTIKGIGAETKDIYNPIKKIPETVHSYGWYLNKFVEDIKQKGAIPIICSPIPRNDWKAGKVNRANAGYGLWAKQVAENAGVYFIELNGMIADEYDAVGEQEVKKYFTEKDHTHTNEAGAKLNAAMVARGIAMMPGGALKDGVSAQNKIDRKALVLRHTVHNTQIDSLESLSLGNGKFAFTVDATGLQTFPKFYQNGIPLGTQSEWGWHSFKDTVGYQFAETLKDYDFDNRKVSYSVQVKEPMRNKQAADWFRQNVHRLQLGNLGFELIKKDGSIASIEDIRSVKQELNMWTGEISSEFIFEGEKVSVKTLVHPQLDMVAVKVDSKLLLAKRLKISVRFPFPSNEFLDMGTNYASAKKHQSMQVLGSNIKSKSTTNAVSLKHQLDTNTYFANLKFSAPISVKEKEAHHFSILSSKTETLEFTCHFAQKAATVNAASKALPNFEETLVANRIAWESFWTKGAAVDFSHCKDNRAKELERRVVLSQWLTKIQCSGSEPPQETGLTYNSWYGKPHLEMHWWHGVHFALWNRMELLEPSMDWYFKVKDQARLLAARQGYEGVRWQKMTDPEGRESPSSVGAFLIWQQPHIISFAELAYRQQPSAATRNKYASLVFETANFMADYARYDSVRKNYVLGKGLIPAQERFKAEQTYNPTYELAYWHWGLKTAQLWRERMGMNRNATWDDVLNKLSPLPKLGDVYLATESAQDSYTNPVFLTDHPAVLGTFGMLPNTGMLDTAVMRKTFDLVWEKWDWKDTWGWDFPMTAMTATRLGLPEKAVEALLMPIKTNRYLTNGHNYQDARLRLYLPGNGGLLTAIAIMCAGYDGNQTMNPGFPKNGLWDVRWEGMKKFF